MNKMTRLLTVLLLLVPTIANAWWNDEWNFRKKITLDTTVETGAGIQSANSEVPVLLRLHTGNFEYFLDVLPDGADIRFVAGDDKTPLKHHIERFDPINQMALVWVKIPSVKAAANTESIFMYYGNSSAVSGKDVAGSYDAHQSLVYHFDQADGAAKDGSAFNNNPVQYSAVVNANSLIGAGTRFDGNNIISIDSSPSLRFMPEKGLSFSVWLKTAEAQNSAHLLSMGDENSSIVLGIEGTSAYVHYRNAGGVGYETPMLSGEIKPGAWHHLALTISVNTISFYIDGAEVAQAPATVSELVGKFVIGAGVDGTNGFVGEMDELQVANTTRSADWVRLAALSQGPGSTMLTYGGDEQSESAGGETSYFKTTLQNVTVDGWVVIVILAIMSVISWVVMFGKGLIINRTNRDNQDFLEHFKKLSVDDTDNLDADATEEDRELEASPLMAALVGKHDHFQSSSLYRIYHAGIQESKHRLGRAVGAQASGLSNKSLNVIRAALDAELVRENQRLNRQMVLLTIAISGGPFLGLLGTVVGVMITFAAIAATGEVNVNSIAPGIAAALVATVAGLAVAIPALFGYNYIGSRIKDISADMHVFVDEFIAKIADQHGA